MIDDHEVDELTPEFDDEDDAVADDAPFLCPLCKGDAARMEYITGNDAVLYRQYSCECGAHYCTREALSPFREVRVPMSKRVLLESSETRKLLPPGRYLCRLSENLALIYERRNTAGKWFLRPWEARVVDKKNRKHVDILVGTADDVMGDGCSFEAIYKGGYAEKLAAASRLGFSKNEDMAVIFADRTMRAAIPRRTEHYYRVDEYMRIVYKALQGGAMWVVAFVDGKHKLEANIGLADDEETMLHRRGEGFIAFENVATHPKTIELRAKFERLHKDREVSRAAYEKPQGLAAPL